MKFSELSVSQKFILNNEEYVKIEPVKVSCCRSVVAQKTATGERVSVNQNDEVTQVQE